SGQQSTLIGGLVLSTDQADGGSGFLVFANTLGINTVSVERFEAQGVQDAVNLVVYGTNGFLYIVAEAFVGDNRLNNTAANGQRGSGRADVIVQGFNKRLYA